MHIGLAGTCNMKNKTRSALSRCKTEEPPRSTRIASTVVLSALINLSERAKRVLVALSECLLQQTGAPSAGLGLRAISLHALLFTPPLLLSSPPSALLSAPPSFYFLHPSLLPSPLIYLLFAPPMFTNCSLFCYFCFFSDGLP